MGSSMSQDLNDPRMIRNSADYQLAVSNRLFSDEVGLDDLPCMNCLRVEMGERACYTGICDVCGRTPPCLRWMYPDAPLAQQARLTRRRPPRLLAEGRSQSTDRPEFTRPSLARHQRRLSADSVIIGISPARLDMITFTHKYRKVVGVDATGEEKDASTCVICLEDFEEGVSYVRRLGCLHLFHVYCVDAWLIKNRCCPVCRIDVESAAAQFS